MQAVRTQMGATDSKRSCNAVAEATRKCYHRGKYYLGWDFDAKSEWSAFKVSMLRRGQK